MPKTKIIYTDIKLENMEGEVTSEIKGMDEFLTEIRGACIQVGIPSFLRTGHLSNKHDWKHSCFIDRETLKDKEKLREHIFSLVEMSALATIDRVMPIDFWAVREFIETEPYFHYFSGEMPITKERRYFVRDGKIECHHNYWDRKAFGNDIDEKKYEEMAKLTEEDEKTLNSMASYVAHLFSGYWSVDFLKGKNGTWYMTDMAIGERSHHPPCPVPKSNRTIK
jgi:hypothetical protein